MSKSLFFLDVVFEKILHCIPAYTAPIDPACRLVVKANALNKRPEGGVCVAKIAHNTNPVDNTALPLNALFVLLDCNLFIDKLKTPFFARRKGGGGVWG